jgi:secondary thiamine-phosphate synthase enzyme
MLNIETRGRGTYDITAAVRRIVTESKSATGLCHLFIRHTSASLIVCENAAPEVRTDLERFMSDLVPDGDPRFEHRDEGPDDMPAHVRTVLTQTDMTIPVEAGDLMLGTWQGVYVWEHRSAPQHRRVVVTVRGED